jgi:molecular chaperone DnaK
LKEAEEVVKGDDKDVIISKTEALSTAAHKLSEKLQAAEAAKQPGADAGAAHGESKKDEGDVVDAEFTEVKNDKK